MQLVLLSGGSGKRLWPLSNDARSKQFLPLLKTANGSMESMIQRVVRQVKESLITNDITLATNDKQLDIIYNQLGNNVNVVTEPERRDTFPAIALAVSYLKYKKNCSDDEVVVIMPCDPYTDSEYFYTIKYMEECVNQSVADLVLMGITPTYPSEKFGYVIPTKRNENEIAYPYQTVSSFIEKPKNEIATQLISEGAFWNGGVFAFRLGYMIDIVTQYMQYTNFDDVRQHYTDFPKISFDYEVVEKAKSVAVVPFKGKWKDLGTWNTISSELHHNVIGNAILGEHAHNTNIINELNIPIYVDGLLDSVVAASVDGILVCSKEYSENIKSKVEHLTNFPMYVEKRWGTYKVLDNSKFENGFNSITRSILVKEGMEMDCLPNSSYILSWTVVDGKGIFTLNNERREIKRGDTVVIPVGYFYALRALTQLTLIEIQTTV